MVRSGKSSHIAFQFGATLFVEMMPRRNLRSSLSFQAAPLGAIVISEELSEKRC